MSNYVYEGEELDIFSHDTNWKAYWSTEIAEFIRGDVLEVGAGKGTNTAILRHRTRGKWTALEPDEKLARQIIDCETIIGTLAEIPSQRKFHTILYIDVLEHIKDHKGELEIAASHLHPGGKLIVLSPAHQALYTAFDSSIGHFRRYSKRDLVELGPPGLCLASTFYLDSAGLALSIANKVLLKQSMPTMRQIRIWDKVIIPVSRVSDRALGRSIGKSVIAVWHRPAEGA